jgi:hypothetical protein
MFLDDERFPPGDKAWVLVRSSADAIEYVKRRGLPEFISFDHDLGGDDTARRFVLWLIDHLDQGTSKLPTNFQFYVHSQNPIGRDWIEGTMNNIVHNFGVEE